MFEFEFEFEVELQSEIETYRECVIYIMTCGRAAWPNGWQRRANTKLAVQTSRDKNLRQANCISYKISWNR